MAGRLRRSLGCRSSRYWVSSVPCAVCCWRYSGRPSCRGDARQWNHRPGMMPPSKRLLVVLLLSTQAPNPRSGRSTMATPGAEPIAVDAPAPSVQDTEAQVLLRLEDDWALGLMRRDAALFRRLLADGFVYSEDDRTVGRDDVLRDFVAGPDRVQAGHNEEVKGHCFGTTASVKGGLVVGGPCAPGPVI